MELAHSLNQWIPLPSIAHFLIWFHRLAHSYKHNSCLTFAISHFPPNPQRRVNGTSMHTHTQIPERPIVVVSVLYGYLEWLLLIDLENTAPVPNTVNGPSETTEDWFWGEDVFLPGVSNDLGTDRDNKMCPGRKIMASNSEYENIPLYFIFFLFVGFPFHQLVHRLDTNQTMGWDARKRGWSSQIGSPTYSVVLILLFRGHPGWVRYVHLL